MLDVAPYLNAFQRRVDGTEPSWLLARRNAAMKHLSELGFPTRKQEAWRFTDLRPLTAGPILPAEGGSGLEPLALASSFLGGETHRLALVNGRFRADLSSIGGLRAGVFLASTAEALKLRPDLVQSALDVSEEKGAQPFASLNAAFFADGFVLALEPGVVLEKPLEIIHFGEGGRSHHMRNVIHAGAGSIATVIETAASTRAGWTNAVTAVVAKPAAFVRHIKIQNEAAESIHIALTRADVARAARYETFLLTLGARLSRQDIHAALTEEGASVAINGAYLLRGEQEATIATFVDHHAPGCQTAEVLRGVIDDRAHGVFLGKMGVRPGADGTDAHQLNKNLLLSRKASVDTKPELEIFADEVKCSHGATVGDLDENALFYLQARGIPLPAARAMLVEAFAASVIEDADLGEPLTAHLTDYVKGWLGQAGKV